MQKVNRQLGGILLVAGTAIGAGMLALPVLTSFSGFFPSLGLLALCWLFLFTTAWFLLDVNLSIPGEINLITLVGRTLGTTGKIVCWITYLLLLYSLVAAYIAGSAPLFLQGIEWLFGKSPPLWFGPLPLLFLFGIFVYLGTRSVDWVNRLLMFGLIVTYFLLIAFLPPHIQPNFLQHVDLRAIWVAIPVLITSYGFHIVIPTLTTYLHRDVKKLRLIIFLGSLLPFVVYTVWELLILGVVPLSNLSAAWISGQSSATPLAAILHNPWISAIASAFSFFAIVTSFLGVSLSLSDFLTDGLKMKRYSFGREFASLLTFVPPLFFVYAYPRGFILALQFAGIFVAILLCILPALMAWKLPLYRTPPRRLLLLIVIALSLLVIVLDLLEEAGMLQSLIQPYVQT